ncbi:MAG: patatin-like phospholipase family protein [Pyrinomonadaceae bacterium]
MSRDDLESVFTNLHAANLKALCFSGGGIRSATFGLGIVQALAHRGLLEKFDYLSTVSGGGYLGSWMSAWIRRERLKKAMTFNAVSSKEGASQIEREGDAKVRGLSPMQLEALKIFVREKGSPELSQSQKTELAGLSEKELNVLKSLTAAETEELLEDPDFRYAGVRAVCEQINCIEIESDARPTPEPVQLRHLREYSNYMSPKTGLLSADTWTLPAIYLRNLLLNLTIFIPLIAAVLMLPRLLFLIIDHKDESGGVLTYRVLIGAIAAGCLAFAFVISRLPSKQTGNVPRGDSKSRSFRKRLKEFSNSEAGVLLFGVLPLLASAFLAVTAWAWNYRGQGKLYDSNTFAAFKPYPGLEFFVISSVVAFLLALGIFLVINKFRGFNLWESAAALVASVLGGVLLWLGAQKVFNPSGWSVALGPRFAAYEWQVYLCLAVPAFLLVVLVAATIYVGLSSLKASDEDREWLARYGGWVLIFSSAWIIVNGLVLLGPSVFQWMFRPLFGSSQLDWPNVFSGLPAIISTIVGVISGMLSLGGGFSGKSLVRDEPVKSRTSKFLSVAPQIAAVVFLGFILVALAFGSTWLIYYTTQSAEIPMYHAYVLSGSSADTLLLMLVVLAAAGIAMGFVVNVNKFSLHGAYRDRLTRAYLGASNPKRNQNTFTGFDDSDNLELHDLEGQRPFHVINATVNLVGGKNLAWQNRKAASFTMTPLHCGSWAVRGYRRSVDYCVSKTSGKALRLGTAMAISGAAANPNMGYISSPVLTFLMSLFNIRLGWWLGNTGPAGSDLDWFGLGNFRFFQKVGPSIAVFPLINETLGRTDEDKHFLNVSDGGHFENLGLYEMILRRCKFILLSDGAADDSFKFGEISNAIQKCKVDLGVDIKFSKGIKIVSRDTDADGKKGAVRFAVGEITYPEKVDGKRMTGTLLYMRPTYYENEYTDIKYYAEANATFPHQSTGDQMYDEKQFEAYRGLGFFTMTEIVDTFVATAKGDPDNVVDDDLEDLFASETEMRTTVFDFFGLEKSEDYKPRPKAK